MPKAVCPRRSAEAVSNVVADAGSACLADHGRGGSRPAGGRSLHHIRAHTARGFIFARRPRRAAPTMEAFRRKQFELGLQLQAAYEGCATLILGNDILMWVPRVWDRTEVPIQQAVAPLGTMARSSSPLRTFSVAFRWKTGAQIFLLSRTSTSSLSQSPVPDKSHPRTATFSEFHVQPSVLRRWDRHLPKPAKV